MDDSIEGIRVFGTEVRRTTEAQGICDQLKQCRALLMSFGDSGSVLPRGHAKQAPRRLSKMVDRCSR